MIKTLQHRGSVSRFRLPIATAALLAFALAPTSQAQTFTVLYNFGSYGANPYAGLIQDKAGNLYGTTLNGGERDAGTVFELDTTGAVTTLYTFTGRTGDHSKRPYAGVVRDDGGNLWGTFEKGIDHRLYQGFVYRITEGKEYKPHIFTGPPSDGQFPVAGLMRDQTGTLYGTTGGGGTVGDGTVYKLDAGKETILYNFTGMPSDGAGPQGVLVRDAAGNLFGTTEEGGASNFGTVFKLDTTGTETVLHSFTLSDGPPSPDLTLDDKGNLYGATLENANAGSVFKIDTAGDYNILYTFLGGTDGAEVLGPLAIDPSGNLYGTTRYGGNLSCGQSGEGCGEVFELKTTGEKIAMHTFSGPDGMAPSSGVIRDEAGNLYGTAPRGGTGAGVVFKITP
jgi:uncharacterized repeat protein (TIGR03803 family)